jgi:hypothetical protein
MEARKPIRIRANGLTAYDRSPSPIRGRAARTEPEGISAEAVERVRPAASCRVSPAASAGLQRLEARAGAALDTSGDQTVDIEAMAHQFENPQLFLCRFAIDGRDIAGERIGGFAQIGR